VLTAEQVDLVLRHLEEVKASHLFVASKRSQDFLQFVVEHTLNGHLDSLRERMVGVEMFGRPADYDTGNDSVVRVRATEVRRKLAEFYLESNGTRPIRIELPRGCYVPKFIFNQSVNGPAHPQDGPSPNLPSWHATAPLPESVEPPAAVTASEPHVAASSDSRQNRRSFWFLLVGAAVLVLSALAGYPAFKKWRTDPGSGREIRSIVILPLQNLSGDPNQEYFADGLTEELINDLGQVSTLRVISLTSSMSYKGSKKTVPEIARDLAVQGVVEGGVLRDGDRVRIDIQLIDARMDRPIWAHSYVRALNDVLASQGDLARAIADAISVDVTPQEQARLSTGRTIAPDIQDLYLHGILLQDSRDCNQAISYFERVIDAYPAYAQAHSALAGCYGTLGESGQMSYEKAFTLQKAEALKAIQLDDSLSEAHAELANTAMTLDRDWATAETEFRRALELNPNSASVHEKYAFYLVRVGRSREALAEVRKSIDLDPVAASTFHAEGFIYYFSHRYDQALAVTQTMQGLRINMPDRNFLIGDIYAGKNMYSSSIAAFLMSGNSPYTLGHLGNTYARAGQTGEAREMITRLEKDVRSNGIGRYEIALIYAGLGDKKQAFKWLEEAYRAHDSGLLYLKVDPCLDPLRSDPRFADLMRREGLKM